MSDNRRKKMSNPSEKNSWLIHLAKYKEEHPGTSHGEAMKLAKESYVPTGRRRTKYVKKNSSTKKLKKDGSPKAENPWIIHLRAYKEKHPGVSHNDAVKEALKTYKKQEKKKVKEEKKKKPKKVHQCEECDYSTTHKSNFNRHVEGHQDRGKLMKDLAKAKGLLNRYETRAKNKDNSEEKQEEYDKILEEAYQLRDESARLLQALEAKRPKKNEEDDDQVDEDKPRKVITTKTAKAMKLSQYLLDKLNENYTFNTEEGDELNLQRKHIKKTTKDRETGVITIHLQDFEVDDYPIERITLTETDDSTEDEMIYEVELWEDDDLDYFNFRMNV